jgi:hypothetical protein
MPAVIVVVPGVRLMVLCSSVEEKKTVGLLLPATSNCDPGTKSEPRTSSK